jgi:uncharacterized membrane protein YczE
MWITGLLLCPLGVTLATNAGFGVSMIEAPVYILYLKLSSLFSWFTFGMAQYVLQGIALLILCLSIRKFKWRYLLSFGTAVLFGLILDGWRLILGHSQYTDLYTRIICCALGIIITSFAVACFFRTEFPQEVWDLFVKEFAITYKINMTRVKWVYDITSLAVAALLMFLFFRKIVWSAIGIGTIITTFINAPLIGFMGKLIDKLISVEKP